MPSCPFMPLTPLMLLIPSCPLIPLVTLVSSRVPSYYLVLLAAPHIWCSVRLLVSLFPLVALQARALGDDMHKAHEENFWASADHKVLTGARLGAENLAMGA